MQAPYAMAAHGIVVSVLHIVQRGCEWHPSGLQAIRISNGAAHPGSGGLWAGSRETYLAHGPGDGISNLSGAGHGAEPGTCCAQARCGDFTLHFTRFLTPSPKRGGIKMPFCGYPMRRPEPFLQASSRCSQFFALCLLSSFLCKNNFKHSPSASCVLPWLQSNFHTSLIIIHCSS
ncbi:hypothetical protein DL89DRAFT_136655 [Linderina pennispora]|uniref:Uncharacterized protein n=1 Tax=Linderina pennispora TaxID=61395 RepID=A0A1Y1WB83_9FUNG|nr:uncharacterized protein DL89DRAFT_136655 [Linderina pennispora]ORX70625.1 hypothetical protein DL89DRAFT_136655 [Linderina pennispora]